MGSTLTKTCKICNSNAKLVTKAHQGYMQGSFFDVYHCSSCNTSFVDDQDFSTDIYQLIYSNPEQTPGYNRYYYYADSIKGVAAPLDYLSDFEPMYWAVKKILTEEYTDKKAKILEVGSGLGYLTYAIRQQGYDIKGLDISESAVRDANKRFGEYFIAADIFEYYPTNKKSFDLIILTEVIEHLENPKPFIACLLDMLKDGGQVVITTPNKTVDYSSAIWNTELPPVHLWWFSEESAIALANELSCSCRFLDFTNFNKTHFDKMRFKIYKNYDFGPTLDTNGQLIDPQSWAPSAQSGIKNILQKAVAAVSAYEPFNALLTRKEFPIHKSSTLAFILSKNK